MGELAIMFMIIIIISIASVFTLLINKDKVNNTKIYLILIYALTLGWIVYTSAPSNYVLERLIGVLLILIPLVAIAIKNKNFKICKVLLLASVITSTIILIFL